MKRESPARAPRNGVGAMALMLAVASWLALGLWLQPALARRYGNIQQQSDSYALPPKEQVIVASLGYRAALADLIYAHVLVSYGLHFQERRRFEYVGEYLDVITALDPSFVQPYLYADTLLTLQPKPPRKQDYLKAREILLRGTEQFPYHQRVWFTAGQYLAYLAPPHLEDEPLAEEFRLQGAELLSRACELATDNPNIPYHCLSAAAILHRSGKREALIQMLTRTLAVNDDPEIQASARAALRKWGNEQLQERRWLRAQAFDRAWRRDLSFVSKDMLLLLGRHIDALKCAGASITDSVCSTSWRDWEPEAEP